MKETNHKKLSNLTFEGTVIHHQGLITDFNLSFGKMMGYSSKELLGKNIINLLIPKKYHTIVSENIAKKKVLPYEIEVIRKDGSMFPVEIQARAIQKEGDKSLRVASIRDITQRKEAEKLLIFSEEKFELLLESSDDMISIHNLDGTYLYYNGPSCYNLSKSDVLGKTPYDFFEKEKAEILVNTIKGVGKTGKSKRIEIQLNWFDEIKWFSEYFYLMKGNEEKSVRIVKVCRDITERKKVEEELIAAKETAERNENELISAQELARIGSWYLDLESNKAIWSKELYKIYGFDPSLPVPLYTEFMKLFIPKSWNLLSTTIENTIKTGIPYQLELRTLNKDGSIGWIWANGKVVKDDNGEVIALRGLAQDITLKKEEEKEKEKQADALVIVNKELLFQNKEKEKLYKTIEQSEKKFRKLYEKSGDAIFIFSNGVIIDCNKAALDLFKLKTKEDVLNSHPSKMSPKFQPNGLSSKNESEEMLKIALKNETHRFEWIHTKSNGEDFPVEIVLTTIINEPNNMTLHAVVRDITVQNEGKKEIIKAKKTAEESEKYLHNIINNMGDPVNVKNSKRKVILVNNAFCDTFKISEDDIIGRLHSQKNITPKELKKIIDIDKQVLSDGKESITEDHLNIDSKLITISTRKTRFIGSDGEKYIIGVTRDISEIRLAEKELIEAKEKAEESDRLKTEFLNNMSHEIRTPMNGILGFSEFLNDPYLDDSKRKTFVKIIQNSGNQLLRVIDDIIEISKLETKQVKLREEKVNLNNLLFELFSVFDLKAKENQISLYLEKGLSDSNSVILLDNLKLHKVMNNLLENALKFTNQGQINFGYKLGDHKLEFYVRDTGIGIPKDKREIIFKRFSQADKELSKKAGGLGLGLSIAKENVMLLGGDIHVESKIMVGSTFRFDIPFKPFDSDIEIDKNKMDDKKKLTFLIVEDEVINFMFIEILLLEKLKNDCHIIHAINGKEAVEICENNVNIDLILMDLKMPIMNGFEATRLIKEFRPNLPIIAQSAYTSDEDIKKAKDAGCNDFISKPIKKEILNKSINNFIKC